MKVDSRKLVFRLGLAEWSPLCSYIWPMLYVARRSISFIAVSMFALILGASAAPVFAGGGVTEGTSGVTTLDVAVSASDRAAGVTLPPIIPPTFVPHALKLPNFPMRHSSPISEQARIRLTETMIEHSLQLAVTSVPCDSTMSSAQCLGWLLELPENIAPQFATISLQTWAQSIPEIDAVLERVVSKDTETMRWQMLRGLGIQARETIAKLTRKATQSTRTTPETMLNLNSAFGVSRLEIVHRVLISGDRIMVDHIVVDRSNADLRVNSKIDEAPPQDLVDTTDSLRGNVEASMKTLAESTRANVAKMKIKK
ncbi:hypothetical protein BH10BDE1_BH10BDE1_00130 [soil metagenome]